MAAGSTAELGADNNQRFPQISAKRNSLSSRHQHGLRSPPIDRVAVPAAKLQQRKGGTLKLCRCALPNG